MTVESRPGVPVSTPGPERPVDTPVAVAATDANAVRAVADLLQTIRRAMGADTGTILLVDRTRTVLEPFATVGLDRTLLGARRVPLGQGFAGRVAQTRQPVVLAEVTMANVINPVLVRHGVHSLLGVPIIVGSELLGVLHVGHRERHEFCADEVRRLTDHAAELADRLQERFLKDEHTAALTLQRSLLPTALSVPDGVSVAARYIPAEGDLGGDWYDVFELPGDRLALVMGDVVGHGLASAIVMGRLRSALRAYALEHDDPAEVLTRLDRKICHFEPNAFATVLLGFATAPYAEWRFSSAGHHPPLVGSPGRSTVQTEVSIDRLLGLDPEVQRHSSTVQVPEDGFVCLFTDGLVERRPGPGEADVDIVGLNVLRLAGALQSADDPEMACIRVLDEVVGDRTTEDDIAVLVAKRTVGRSSADR